MRSTLRYSEYGKQLQSLCRQERKSCGTGRESSRAQLWLRIGTRVVPLFHFSPKDLRWQLRETTAILCVHCIVETEW